MKSEDIHKEVNQYLKEGLIEITRNGLLSCDFKTIDGVIEHQYQSRGFYKGRRIGWSEVYRNGVKIDCRWYTMERVYMYFILYCRKLKNNGTNN